MYFLQIDNFINNTFNNNKCIINNTFIRLAWKRKANTPPAENSNKQYRTELYSSSQPTSTCRDPGR